MTPERSAQKSAFVTTQWTRVLQARGDSLEAKAALSDLCSDYYPPVFAFMRQHALDEEAARDLTQEFFARILAGHGIGAVEPHRGRFRSYLLGAVKHFLADMRDQAGRLKRGAGVASEPLESGSDTSPGLQLPDPNATAPDGEFDRKWAMTLLDRALASLAEENKQAGNLEQFEILKPWLTGDSERASQTEAGERLGMNDGAVKVAIHRLRKRFRGFIKTEIARTVQDAQQVEQEMKDLLQALL